MSTPQDKQQAIRSADALTERVAALASEARRLRTYGRRNRLFVVFDIALTVAFIFLGWTAHHNSVTIDQLRATNGRLSATITQFHDNTVGSCEAFNSRLQSDKVLWDFLINKSHAPADATPQQKAQSAELLRRLQALVNSKDAPRNCTSIFSLHH